MVMLLSRISRPRNCRCWVKCVTYIVRDKQKLAILFDTFISLYINEALDSQTLVFIYLLMLTKNWKKSLWATCRLLGLTFCSMCALLREILIDWLCSARLINSSELGGIVQGRDLRNMIQLIMSVEHGVMSVFYYIIKIHLYMTWRQGEGCTRDKRMGT